MTHRRPLKIALVGDYDPTVIAHQAIPRALELAAEACGKPVQPQWLPTERISRDADLDDFDAIWCVPASPYRSTEGALRAIRYTRERNIPFLGTCGGFQHAVLEYARSVLGWTDAGHAETVPDAGRLVVSPLSCSLVEVNATVHFVPGTRIAAAYGALDATEGYHCNYGLNPDARDALAKSGVRIAVVDAAGDVRGIELVDHPFFVATLFQPERAALRGVVPALVVAFIDAAIAVRNLTPVFES